MTMCGDDDDMEVIKVDPTQTHRVSLAPRDRAAIAVTAASIVLGVLGVVWKFSLDVTETAAELHGDIQTIETKVDGVKNEVAELRTDIREVRQEARNRQ